MDEPERGRTAVTQEAAVLLGTPPLEPLEAQRSQRQGTRLDDDGAGEAHRSATDEQLRRLGLTCSASTFVRCAGLFASKDHVTTTQTVSDTVRKLPVACVLVSPLVVVLQRPPPSFKNARVFCGPALASDSVAAVCLCACSSSGWSPRCSVAPSVLPPRTRPMQLRQSLRSAGWCCRSSLPLLQSDGEAPTVQDAAARVGPNRPQQDAADAAHDRFGSTHTGATSKGAAARSMTSLLSTTDAAPSQLMRASTVQQRAEARRLEGRRPGKGATREKKRWRRCASESNA